MQRLLHNLQLRQYRLIQQINRLLEPLILYECRIRELKQTATMLLPEVTVQRSGLRDTVTADFGWRVAAQRYVGTRIIVVIFEKFQFPLQVKRVPE